MLTRCNLSCSYCIENRLDMHETPAEEQERVIRQAGQIRRLIDDNPQWGNIAMYLIGGEVTLIPQDAFSEVLHGIGSGRIAELSVVTNFTAPLGWYQSAARHCKENGIKFSVTASWHDEFWKLDNFLAKATEMRALLARTCPKHCMKVECVITRKNWDEAARLHGFAREHGIFLKVDYNRKEQWAVGERTLLSTSKFDREQNLRSHTEDTAGYTCSYNRCTSTIHPDGKIYGVACRNVEHYGLLGVPRRVAPKPVMCHNHKCSLCGRVRITRPDGSVYFDREFTKEAQKIDC